MRSRIPSFIPSLRQVILWIMLGLLLAAIFHGYWLLSGILFVGIVALFVLTHAPP